MRNPGEPLRDHTGEMRSHHGPTDEAIEALLDGTPSQELAGTPLADLVDRIRLDAATTEPTASPELASLMVHGLAPSETGALPATAGSNATAPTSAAWLPKWTRSAATYRKLIITKLAALGVLVKAGAAGASVVVVAAGVGAAGALPPSVQNAFDRIAEQGEEEPTAEIEELEESPDTGQGLEDESASVDDEDGSVGDGPPEGSFGKRVSEDARDVAGGEGDGPGVDGQQISREARQRAVDRAEDREFGGPSGDKVGDDEQSIEDVDSVESDDDSDGDGPPEGRPVGPPSETPVGPPNTAPTADQS